ncbi:MAG: endonuclease [Pedosphaera sp.]|nr:endonuclease [Pedosphaera sp.]
MQRHDVENVANRCQYTGVTLRPEEGNIDHVVPRSRGGRDAWENRAVLECIDRSYTDKTMEQALKEASDRIKLCYQAHLDGKLYLNASCEQMSWKVISLTSQLFGIYSEVSVINNATPAVLEEAQKQRKQKVVEHAEAYRNAFDVLQKDFKELLGFNGMDSVSH